MALLLPSCSALSSQSSAKADSNYSSNAYTAESLPDKTDSSALVSVSSANTVSSCMASSRTDVSGYDNSAIQSAPQSSFSEYSSHLSPNSAGQPKASDDRHESYVAHSQSETSSQSAASSASQAVSNSAATQRGKVRET